MKKPWPKLSECAPVQGAAWNLQLVRERGGGRPSAQTAFWREHDDNDQPTGVVICLCRQCSDRLIEPHPRLYGQLDQNEPAPGAMPWLCEGCMYRNGLTCGCPDSKWNGGKGMGIVIKLPSRGFACSRGHGCRSIVSWPEPARSCEGRKVAGETL